MNAKAKAHTITLFLAVVLGAILALPAKASAQQEIICQVVYGQGEICGVKTVAREEVLAEHAPVQAGLQDINFKAISLTLAASGAVFFLLSKISKRIYLLDR